jgi:hypothetical protein
MLIYDCEIAKLIPTKDEPKDPKFEYCKGWGDHLGMGLSVVSVYDFEEGFPRIFMEDNLDELFEMMEKTDIIAGFNSKHFDNKLIAAHGYTVPDEKTFDLFLEIKEAAGAHKFAKGYNLDNCCLVNLGYQKSGDGALAPKLWQQGRIGAVVDYALRDIMLEMMLLELCIKQPIIDPGNTSSRIFVKKPETTL